MTPMPPMMPPDASPIVIVTAAVIERDGKFLITRRPDGAHLAGYWEFPGGKCDPGESLVACLTREIREELDAMFEAGGEIFSTSHTYPGRVVELHFFRGTLTEEPRPTLGQEMRWVRRDDLQSLDFPPADAELIARLGSGEL